ncbi:MAG: hypothetical protein GF392_03555 [Candidatus Omnitrophica bacterium]|nr:hypothetical protein [Candidatus Omnitrophota bacterium]
MALSVTDPMISSGHFTITISASERKGWYRMELVDTFSTNGTGYRMRTVKETPGARADAGMGNGSPDAQGDIIKRRIEGVELMEKLREKPVVTDLNAGESKLGHRVYFDPDEIERDGRGSEEAEDLINDTHMVSSRLFRRVASYFTGYLNAGGEKKEVVPVDIVLDMSLIPAVDLKENAGTLVCLMLMCREMKNVNFLFEIPFSSEKEISPELADAHKRAAAKNALLGALLAEMHNESIYFGMSADDVNDFFSTRIDTPRRAGAVEIPIISEEALKWAKEHDIGLIENNQYPVALEGPACRESGGALLSNFEAGFTLAVAKAGLVLAKKRDAAADAADEKEFPRLKKKVIGQLRDLFKALPFTDPLGNNMEVKINDRTLDYMVHEDVLLRVNMAISLALPKIIRLPVEKLRELHEGIQLALKAA